MILLAMTVSSGDMDKGAKTVHPLADRNKRGDSSNIHCEGTAEILIKSDGCRTMKYHLNLDKLFLLISIYLH